MASKKLIGKSIKISVFDGQFAQKQLQNTQAKTKKIFQFRKHEYPRRAQKDKTAILHDEKIERHIIENRYNMVQQEFEYPIHEQININFKTLKNMSPYQLYKLTQKYEQPLKTIQFIDRKHKNDLKQERPIYKNEIKIEQNCEESNPRRCRSNKNNLKMKICTIDSKFLNEQEIDKRMFSSAKSVRKAKFYWNPNSNKSKRFRSTISHDTNESSHSFENVQAFVGNHSFPKKLKINLDKHHFKDRSICKTDRVEHHKHEYSIDNRIFKARTPQLAAKELTISAKFQAYALSRKIPKNSPQGSSHLNQRAQKILSH